MIRLRTLGLALVAVFAMSAVAAGSASAKTCAELGFTNPCLVNAAGTGVKGVMKTESKAVSKLETKSGKIVECTSNKGESTPTTGSAKHVEKATVTFAGCKGEGLKCANQGTEEIKTNSLEGEIGYISAAEHTVGLDLWPSSRTAKEREKGKKEFLALFVTFTCGGFVKNEARGSVIGKMTPVGNTLQTTFTLTYSKKGTEKGIQEFNKLENVEEGVPNQLESSIFGGGFEKSNQQGTETVTPAETAELKG